MMRVIVVVWFPHQQRVLGAAGVQRKTFLSALSYLDYYCFVCCEHNLFRQQVQRVFDA